MRRKTNKKRMFHKGIKMLRKQKWEGESNNKRTDEDNKVGRTGSERRVAA